MMNRYLFYFAVVTLLIVFDASTLVKIWGIIAAVLVASAWRKNQFRRLPLVGWLFERNPR